MASIRARGAKWHAQVRRQGYTTLTKSFAKKADAEAWARQRETEIDQGRQPADTRLLSSMTLTDLMRRYEREVLPEKKCRHVEVYYLRAMAAHRIGNTTLDKLSQHHFAAYRDERLTKVSASSVRREFNVFRHCLAVAIREWGVGLRANPLSGLRLPPSAHPRERRVSKGELEALASAIRKTRNPLVIAIVNFAIGTGMRRGEILSFTWGDVDIARRLVRLRDTKNGSPRSVPLGPMALGVLQSLPQGKAGDHVFFMSPNALRLSWTRITRRAGIANLRLHDLRHEAISRFFEAGLSVPEVALISGHKDPRMLFRYTHLRPENVAVRLHRLMCEGTDGVTLDTFGHPSRHLV